MPVYGQQISRGFLAGLRRREGPLTAQMAALRAEIARELARALRSPRPPVA